MTRAHRLSFLKVLAAMAWADGEVEDEERNRIKVLFNRFELDPADRKEVDALLDAPVTFERALELTKEFAGRIAPPGTRKQLLQELEEMIGAKGERAPQEDELLDHVRAILAGHTVVDGLVEKMRGLFSRTLFSGRSGEGSAGRLTEYAKNHSLQQLNDRFREKGWTLDRDLPEWNRVTLLGVLLADVALLGEGWGHGEREVVAKVLSDQLDMNEPQRALLLEVMGEERNRDTDLQKICAEYCRISTMEERLEIVDALFAVAGADGAISKDEVERIRKIADLLWISNPEYLSVRDRYRERIAS
jgi:uncharacterized tellurite resistance protein B-like protein